MGENAIKSHGTKVYRGTAGALPFVLIDEVRDVTPPSRTRTIHNATSQSDTRPYKLTGMPDSGDFQFGILYSPGLASHEAILDDYEADVINIYKVEYSNAATEIFSGAVANFEPSAPLDDIVTANVTVAVFGEIARS